jgi:hypothetical protein
MSTPLIETTQLELPEMEGTLSPVPVAWVGLCPRCRRVVAATLILPKEKQGDTYQRDLQQTLGEWQLSGMACVRVWKLPTLDGCVTGCTWEPEHHADLTDDE